MKKLSIVVIAVFSCTQAIANNASNINNLLNRPIEELLEIKVVSATKTPIAINQAPNTISAYNYKEIQNLGARKISDLLWLVAGIQMQISSNGRERAWIRGVQSEFNNKIVLYIDNVPIRDVFGGFAIDEEIPIEAIEKIEIIRGPGGALYGANAFSGVINISTFQAGHRRYNGSANDEASNTVKASVGEQNTHSGYFSLQKKLAETVDVLVEAKGIETGRKPEYDRYSVANSRPNGQSLGYLRLNASALDGELLFNATYNAFNNIRVDLTAPDTDNQLQQNLRFSLAYKHAFNDAVGLEMNVYHANVQRLENQADYENNSLANAYRFVDETDLTGLYLAANYRPIESNQLVTGFEVKREALLGSNVIDKITGQTSSYIQDPRYRGLALMTYGFFAQDSQDIFSEKTKLTFGLRLDKLDLFGEQVSYRAGLTHNFTDNFYGKLLYGRAYRAPNFIEFSRAPINAVLPTVEKMGTTEIQLGYQDKKKRLGLTGYWNQYDDLIARKNSFNYGSFNLADEVFGNVDHQEIFGTELEAQVFLNDQWNVFLNASWSNARTTEQHAKLPLLANWTTAMGFEWRDRFSFGELTFNNHLVIYGDRQDWPSSIWNEGQQQRYSNRGSGLNDGFAVWNSTLHYKLPLGKKQAMDFDVSVHNLLNKQYYTQTLTPPSSNSIAKFDNQYQERQLRFTVSYCW